MDKYQEKIKNELKKIIIEDIPKNIRKEQYIKLKKIEKELYKDEYKS